MVSRGQNILSAIRGDVVRRYCFCLFAFLLPISQQISTIFIALWTILSLATIQKKYFFREKKLRLLAYLYIAHIASLLYSEHFIPQPFEQKASLIVFPLLFFLNGQSIIHHMKMVLHSFVYGCILAVAYLDIVSLYHSFQYTEEKGWVFLIDFNNFYRSIRPIWISSNFSTIHQTVYFANYLFFSCLILWFFPWKKRWKNLITWLFLGSAMIQISNKATLLIAPIVIGINIWKSLKKVKHRVIGVLVILVILVSLVTTVPILKNMVVSLFEGKTTTDIKNTRDVSSSLRLQTWETSLEIIKDNPVLGVGIGDEYPELSKRYVEKGYDVASRMRLNSHNTYFTVWIQMGLVGLWLIGLYFYNLYQKGMNTEKIIPRFYISFILLLALNFLFETMLSRYSGIVFISFMYCLLISNQGDKQLGK